MKLINPKFEIIEQQEGRKGIYKQIELAGRTCYKSERNITPTSANKFVNNMINSGHGSMLEHGTVYLKMHYSICDRIADHNVQDYINNKYSKVRKSPVVFGIGYYVTTNLRVLVENNWLDDLKYLCEPTKYHEKRVTVRFNLGIDISREFNRHRVNSMAEQSTRYCNYSRDRFDNELSIMQPSEFTEEEINECLITHSTDSENIQDSWFRNACKDLTYRLDDSFSIIDTWLFAHLATEWAYMRLIKLGWKPQQARKVLNLDTASELVHTAFVSDWEHFFELRDAEDAHPDAQALAKPLHKEFIKRGYIK